MFPSTSTLDFGPFPYKAREPKQKQKQTIQSPPQEVSTVARTTVSLEYASLRYKSHCPLGIYVVPSSESLMTWDAVLFVHQGYYESGVFKFRLSFPHDYPERPPTVQFITDVFHPLISSEGILNLSARFRPWRPKEHHIFDILHYVKKAFKKEALDSFKEHDCLNKEAYRLYHDATQTFSNLARQSSQLSISSSALFQKDHPSTISKPGHSITFRELKTDQLQERRAKLGLKEWDQDEQS